MSRSKPQLVKNTAALRQIILFEGLQKGRIALSDLDAVLEFDNNYLVLFEVKKRGVDIPRGQRMMLETLVNVWHDSGRIGILVKATHITDSSEDILLKNCEVEEVYYNKAWKPLGGINVKEFLNNFYKKNNITL